VARYLRETADCWDAHIETWCYLPGTDLAEHVGVDGFYVRIGPPDVSGAVTPLQGWIPIKNRPPGEDRAPARSVVSPDALALVRFGLRASDDPRILDTIRVIDAVLETEFPYGPGWRRYNDDGYGEHADGRPFDGTGRGRVWPLLTGERGHVAVAAGDPGTATDLARTMQSMAGPGGMLPEQVWDAPDIPERELWFGKPTGSAMPLVWAHAEYLKLLRSIADGAVFDLPAPVQRHRPDPAARSRRFWRTNHKIRRIEEGASLRIELPAPACIHWSVDGWTTANDGTTVDTGIGMHVVDFDAAALPSGAMLRFTIRWEDRWEGTDYEIAIGGVSS
jgi:glucoamylase